jgi:hypothetical protein
MVKRPSQKRRRVIKLLANFGLFTTTTTVVAADSNDNKNNRGITDSKREFDPSNEAEVSQAIKQLLQIREPERAKRVVAEYNERQLDAIEKHLLDPQAWTVSSKVRAKSHSSIDLKRFKQGDIDE